jgi:hypothetical protein
MTEKWSHWHYKNTTMLILSFLVLFYIAESAFIDQIILIIGALGYFGAFITGILFVSVFTIAPAGILLYHLSSFLNPFLIALFAGAGAVIGDYLIFRFFKDKVFQELQPVFVKNGGRRLLKLFKTPYFSWAIPFIGAFIIASPFPDEVGVGLLGMSKLKNWQFMFLSFILNAIGILFIVLAASAF